MEPKKNGTSPKSNSGVTPKRKKPLPLSKRIYRAVYTFVYVVLQLAREGLLWLFEKAEALYLWAEDAFVKIARFLLALKEQWFEKKSREEGQFAKEEAHASVTKEKQKEKAPFVEKLRSVFSKKKEPLYAEKDFLEFEEEERTGKKKSKKKKKDLPTFDDLLLYNEEKKQRRARRWQKVLTGFLTAALALQIFFLAFLGGLYIYTGNSFSFGSMDLYLKEGKETVKYELPQKVAYTQNGTPRVDFNVLAKFLELEAVSDQNYAYYTLTDGKRIVFIKDSATAFLDDCRVTLSEKVIFSGTKVYVPVDLIVDYTEGIGVSYSEKEKRLTLTRQKDEELSNSRGDVYKEWILNVSAIEKAPLPEIIP